MPNLCGGGIPTTAMLQRGNLNNRRLSWKVSWPGLCKAITFVPAEHYRCCSREAVISMKASRFVAIVLTELVIAKPVWLNAASLAYAPAPADNPLKGFVPYPGEHPTFPHSLEWDYTKLSEVMTGPTNFDWSLFERKLTAAESRGCQFIARFYLEWPGRTTGVPQFLLDEGVTLRSWTNASSQGSSPVVNYTPNYEDDRLRAALQNFIYALGARYDGDVRLGFIEIGLLGEWGEWHDWPKDEWFASKIAQAEVLNAFEDAFKKTRLLARYPAGPGHPRYADNSRRALGYHDDSFAWATVHTGKKGDGWFFETLLRQADVLEKWRYQPIGGEVRPEVWDCLFNQPSCAPKGQEFEICAEVTHVSWLCNQGVFRPSLKGSARERAVRGAQRVGYELQVTEASLAIAGSELEVNLSLINRGLAPFYYDWPVELALLDSAGSIVLGAPSTWRLTNVQPGNPVHWAHRIRLTRSRTEPFRVLLRVPNPMAGGKPLRFANRDQDRDLDGWLTLGEVEPKQ